MEYGAVAVDQFANYIKVPSQEAKLKNSSLIASIDGLYWPTIYGPEGDCSWANYAIRGTRSMNQIC